ncbi:aminoglycoside phosphotransferase family protein [Oscillospiraceae bacterium HV4-5-C5C]|nr:aminoglycoside phosphotransferase family protein [Oscillospiraceae bacterium HV4-5-C5C]
MDFSSKNRQPRAVLQRLAEAWFPEKRLAAIKELTEGFFNVSYALTWESGETVILKIAPSPLVPVMTYERAVMAHEVRCMSLLREQTELPVARVMAWDRSHRFCDADCFFMTCLPGQSLSRLKPALSPEQLAGLQTELGGMTAQINQLRGPVFGYWGQPHCQSADWFTAFSYMLQAALTDCAAVDLDPGTDWDRLWRLLLQTRGSFLPVTQPRLVHWDLWDGNIFVQDGRISGLIDFERCLWADPLMEVAFRSYNQDPDFLRGYGITTFDSRQRCRILWYDLYLYILCAMEGRYRQYPEDGTERWARAAIPPTLAELGRCAR